MAKIFMLHKMYDGSEIEIAQGTWPQPIEGYDYPTGTLPGTSFRKNLNP
jgi:hypothetical protein